MMVPILRGKLVRDDASSEVTWSGKWAFSVDQHKQGDVSKFQMKGKADESEGGGASSSSGAFPPSVVRMSGFFVVKREGADDTEGVTRAKIKETDVVISFEKGEDGKYKASGSGKNKFGPFILAGRYNPDKGTLQATKTYVQAPEEDSDSGSDSGSVPDMDADEIADELRALKEDAAEHGMAVPPVSGGSGGAAGGRKRKAVVASSSGAKRVRDDDGDDEEDEDDEDYDEVAAAAADREADASGNEAHPASDPWALPALQSLKRKLDQAVRASDTPGIGETLGKLERGGTMTVDLLKATGLGKDVKALRKYSDPATAARALRLVDTWKAQITQQTVQ